MRVLMIVGWVALAGCKEDGATGFGNADADVAAIGSPCGGALACPPSLTCVGNGQGAFFCMQHCDDIGGLCAAGPLCVELADGAGGVCYVGGDQGKGVACTSSLQCAAGLGCIGGDERFCVPFCQPATGEGCAADARCVAFGDNAGRCQDRIGSRCAEDAECASATLTCQLAVAPWAAITGSCTQACASDTDCSGDAVCLLQGGEGRCVDGCTRDGHCRAEEGFRCTTADDCVGQADEAACRTLLGARHVCMKLP